MLTAAERSGDFSQSVLAGRIRTIYDLWSSTLNSARCVVRNAFDGNIIPANRLDSVAVKLLNSMPLPNQPGNVDNWQGTLPEKVDYWNFSQRVDLNITDNWKISRVSGSSRRTSISRTRPTPGCSRSRAATATA